MFAKITNESQNITEAPADQGGYSGKHQAVDPSAYGVPAC
jgi:hypothetical protein